MYITSIFDVNYGKCFQIEINRKQVLNGQGLSLMLNLNDDRSSSVDSFHLDEPYFDGIIFQVLKFLL